MAFVHIKLILRRFQLRLTCRSDGKANGQPAACCNAVNIMDDRQAQTASLIIIGKGTRIPVSYTHLDVYKRQLSAGGLGG